MLILGVGNKLWSDDAFGTCLAEALQVCKVSGPCEVKARATFHVDLLPELEGYDVVVFVDVYIPAEGGEPGEVHVLRIEEASVSEEAELMSEVHAHYISPIHLTVMARRLGLFSGEAYVVGVVPERLGPGTLSDTLRSALPRVYNALNKLVSRFGCTLPPLRCVEERFEEACRSI